MIVDGLGRAYVGDLGFDLLQGHMFAKPMTPRKFERAMLARRYAAVA